MQIPGLRADSGLGSDPTRLLLSHPTLRSFAEKTRSVISCQGHGHGVSIFRKRLQSPPPAAIRETSLIPPHACKMCVCRKCWRRRRGGGERRKFKCMVQQMTFAHCLSSHTDAFRKHPASLHSPADGQRRERINPNSQGRHAACACSPKRLLCYIAWRVFIREARAVSSKPVRGVCRSS